MIRQENRLLFLREFTKELILNSKAPEIKAKIKESEEAEEEREKRAKSELKKYEISVPIKPEEVPEAKVERKKKPRAVLPRVMPRYRLRPVSIKPFPKTEIAKIPKIPARLEAREKPKPIPEFDLGKINFLIQDPRVTGIECPGPNKLILAKTLGETKVTKLSLNQEEIQGIIEKFSAKAKIPVISGLFKAAVGNLIITAVISKLVGSRFIISKMTPRFMLEQAGIRK